MTKSNDPDMNLTKSKLITNGKSKRAVILVCEASIYMTVFRTIQELYGWDMNSDIKGRQPKNGKS